MEDALRHDPATAALEILDQRMHRIRSAATALIKWRSKLPDKRIAEYESLLREWYGLMSKFFT